MRVRAVGHCCLEIEVSGLRVLTDPWWAGPALAGLLHPWPPPQPAGVEQRAVDYLFLSSPREDHLHGPTLATLRPGAAALVPETPGGRLARLARERAPGCCQVTELPHGRPVRLRRGVTATAYAEGDEAVLVLEDGDRVLVHAADALQTAPAAVIDHYCGVLARRHPPVDTLFLGWRATSWFPHCVRAPGLDDRAVAKGREQLAAENFVRVVEALRPRFVGALPPGYALQEAHNRWIEQVRAEVPEPAALCARSAVASASACRTMSPGDVVDGIEAVDGSAGRRRDEGAREAAVPPERLEPLSPTRVADLTARLDARVRRNGRRRLSPAPFVAELRLRDNPGLALHVRRTRTGACAGPGPACQATLWLEVRAGVLEAVLDGQGLDPIVRGFGAVARLEDADRLHELDELLELLEPEESGRLAALRRNPVRELRSLWRQRTPLALHLGAWLGLLSHPRDLCNLDTGAAAGGAQSKAA